MACNGYNHPPDCVCQFRGGHHGSTPPPAPPASLLGNLAPTRMRPFRLGPTKLCEHCGAPLRYVRAPSGGAFFASSEDPLRKHRCPRRVPPDRPRIRSSRWKRQGWLPATVRAVRGKLTGDQRIRVFPLAEAPFRAEVEDGLRIDPAKPVLFRKSVDTDVIEIGYLDETTGELTDSRIRAHRLR